MKKTTVRGFTLIELLIVIAIIGILAAVIIVSVNTARSKASNTRMLAQVAQMRVLFELSLANNTYVDIVGDSTHIDQLSTTSASLPNIEALLCDIGKLNGYTAAVTDDITLTCEGLPNQHTGVIIYSNSTDWGVSDYAVYATSSPSGYVCVDSFGHTNSTSTVSMPDFASIADPATALCQ